VLVLVTSLRALRHEEFAPRTAWSLTGAKEAAVVLAV